MNELLLGTLAVGWPLSGLGLVLLGAVLALDDTALAQTWFSQPLPAGVLAGLICGEPMTGLAIGLPFQLISLGNLPVGQTCACDHVSAVVAGVGGVVLSGHSLSPLNMPQNGNAGGMLGWVLIAMAIFSVAGNWVMRLERRTFLLWMIEGRRCLQDGKLRRADRLQRRCLAVTALRGSGMTAIWLMVLTQLWLPLFAHLPARLAAAMGCLPWLAAPLAVGALLDHYGIRSSWRWFGGSLGLVLLVARWAV